MYTIFYPAANFHSSTDADNFFSITQVLCQQIIYNLERKVWACCRHRERSGISFSNAGSMQSLQTSKWINSIILAQLQRREHFILNHTLWKDVLKIQQQQKQLLSLSDRVYTLPQTCAFATFFTFAFNSKYKSFILIVQWTLFIEQDVWNLTTSKNEIDRKLSHFYQENQKYELFCLINIWKYGM